MLDDLQKWRQDVESQGRERQSLELELQVSVIQMWTFLARTWPTIAGECIHGVMCALHVFACPVYGLHFTLLAEETISRGHLRASNTTFHSALSSNLK